MAAMPADPRIDAYIEKSAPFAQPILQHLRALVHKAYPPAVETIKWSMPFFTAPNGKVIINMAAFKAHCSFGIWNADAGPELAAAGFTVEKAMGSLGRIQSLKDLPPEKLLRQLILRAAEAAEGGAGMMKSRAERKPRAEIEVPAPFAAALRKNKAAQKTFDGFSPSNRREYLEWIAEAKREETRDKRIAQAVEWLAEGKSRNWKYQNC